MYAHITVQNIIDHFADKLDLKWVTSSDNKNTVIRPEPSESISNVGYLNLVHPQQITVIGAQEFNYLAKLDIKNYNQFIEQLINQRPVVIIITDNQVPPCELVQLANQHHIAIVSCTHSGSNVIEHLNYYLSNSLANTVTVHGVFLEVFDRGILLSGKSGIGKSELALELINRGHKLIADDSPTFSKLTPNTLTGLCPKVLRNFLEVRGLGIINIKEMFGSTATKEKKQLNLIIKLVNIKELKLTDSERLEGIQHQRSINNIEIPEITIPVAPGRNLSILVEAAVRNQILKENGYQAMKSLDTLVTASIKTQDHNS